MQLSIRDVPVVIDHFTDDDYRAVCSLLEAALRHPSKVNRQAIKEAFEEGLRRAPNVNPSDLWHHVVYRQYVDIIQACCSFVNDPGQSWKRSSGDAFELFTQDYYNERLAATDVRLIALFGKKDKKKALRLLGIEGQVGDSKLDVAIMAGCDPARPHSLDNGRIVGGLHMKVSFAERVSDDEPCSRAMMQQGYASYLVTLDVKSFPESPTVQEARAYVNKGELGTPNRPSDKRGYIEVQGMVDACFSFNLRTVPTHGEPPSGKKVFVCELDGQWDRLCEELVEAGRRRR